MQLSDIPDLLREHGIKSVTVSDGIVPHHERWLIVSVPTTGRGGRDFATGSGVTMAEALAAALMNRGEIERQQDARERVEALIAAEHQWEAA